MPKYYRQEKEYSCGASALRNVLSHFGIQEKESKVRKVVGTNKNGTDEFDLMTGAMDYGFDVKEMWSHSAESFGRRIKKILKEGKAIILSTDSHQHWIPVLEYKNRKFKIVDSDFKCYKKPIVQWINLKQLIDLAYAYDKEKNKKYFYGLTLTLDAH